MGPLRLFLLYAAAVFVSPGCLQCAGGAPGELDPAFHGTGIYPRVLPGPPGTAIKSSAWQNDGKLLIAADLDSAGITAGYIHRFLPDGSADVTFNGTGLLTLSLPFDTNATVTSIAALPNGKILLTASTRIAGPEELIIARYLDDGSPDPAFGTGQGWVKHPFSWGPGLSASPAVQSSGRILIRDLYGNILGFRADGTVDTGFGNGGSVQYGPGSIGASSLVIQSDDKIIFGFYSTVWRLLPDGGLDTAFGNGGTAALNVPGNGSGINAVLPQTDGTILVGGFTPASEALNPRFLVGRFLPNGTPDPAFDTDGWNAISFPGFNNSEVRSLLVQADGRIIALGEAATLYSALALARFLPDGSLDSGFGTGGLVTTGIDFLSLYFHSATLLPAGEVQVYSPGYLFRYQTGLFPGINIYQPADTALQHDSPTPLDFGLVTVGSRTLEFTVTHWGPSPLTGIAVSLAPDGNPADFAITQPALTTLATGQSTTFLVTFTPSLPGPRTATLRIASSDATYHPFRVPLTGRLTTPLETWRITWFGSPDNSGPGADLNDFDRDGLPNILEFAAGSHPHQPSPPIGTLTKSGDTLTFTWTHPLAALTDLLYQVESAPVPSGPWSSTGITTTVVTADATTQTLRAVIPAPATPGRQFVRLRVTRR